MSRLSFSAQDPTGELVKKWSIELSFLISLPKHRVQMLLNCSLKVQVCNKTAGSYGWRPKLRKRFSCMLEYSIFLTPHIACLASESSDLGFFLYRYCCSLFTKYLKCCNHWMTVDFRLHCANALWVTEWWKRDGNPVQNFNYGATVLLLILPSIRELISSC